jgi:UDP-N-acetylglucosamine 2-epimerase
MKVIAVLNQLKYESIIVDTGQHYDLNMSQIFLSQLKFPHVVNLEVGSDTHGAQTAKIIEGTEKILMNMQPAMVVVVGDTNTTMGAALAAVKLKIPVAHIEAGCRAYDRNIMEEINRVVADSVSSLLFTASLRHWTNLITERQFGKAYNVGDILLDVLTMHFSKIEKVKTLDNLGISSPYYVATIHRDWNVDNPATFKGILEALSSSPIPVIYPIHPRSRKMLRENKLEKYIGKNIQIIDPVSYYDMINLERFSNAVITDSGGIQREAFYLHKLCIALKTSTPEWQELSDCKATILTGTKYETISEILNNLPSFPKNVKPLYGNGTASEQIAKIIGDYIG